MGGANPSDCESIDKFYLPSSHPEYDKMYGVILTAFTAQKELRVYSHTCETVLWYTAVDRAFNIVGSGGVILIRH